MSNLRKNWTGTNALLLALLGVGTLGAGLTVDVATAAAKPGASKRNFKRYVRGWVKWNVRRGKDSATLLEKYRRRWTSKACRKLRGNPRSKCRAWFEQIKGEILREFPPQAPATPPARGTPKAPPRGAHAPGAPPSSAAGSAAGSAGGDVPALVTPVSGDCPQTPTKAGFKKWVWSKILSADTQLEAKLASIARSIAQRSRRTTYQEQLDYFRDMFADLASRNSHPLSRKGKEVIRALKREAKLSRSSKKAAKRLKKRHKSKRWMEKVVAKWEAKAQAYQAKLDQTRNNWLRGKIKRKLSGAQRKVKQWQRSLKRLVAKINKAQTELNKRVRAVCGAAARYLEPYRQALARYIDEYKRWFVVSAEQKKLFATDRGYLKYRPPAMREPSAAAKARAVRLPKGLSGRGRFGPELIPFFRAAKNKLAAERKKSGWPKVSFSTTQYRGHSWSEYSADVWIYKKKVPPGGDRVRYIPREKLLAFFRALIYAGRKTGVVWRALYTDFETAKIINTEAKRRLVRFQWIHGPAPYKDHIHLDMMPKGGR